MTRTRKFLGGLVFGYANQVLITLVGLWFTAFLLGRLGQVDYGLWLVATQILSYLMLMDLGVVALLPRETAFATGRVGGVEHARDLSEIVGQTMRVVLWQMPLVAAVAVVILLALPEKWAELQGPLVVVLGAFVLTFPVRIFQSALEGLQDLAFLGAAHTVSWFVTTGLTVALVFAGLGLYSLAVGWVAGQSTLAVIWAVRLRRRFPTAWPRSIPSMSWRKIRERFVRSTWISLAQVAQVLLRGTDMLVIGAVLGPASVVPYFCTAKLITVFSNQPQMLAQNAQPALSELRASDQRDRLFDVCSALTIAIFLLTGAIACLVLVVNQGFVDWWVGDEQYGGTMLTLVLILGMLLRQWNTATVYAIFAFGHDRRLSLTTMIDGAVTAGLSLLLVWKMDILGAAVASVIGVSLVSLPWNLAALGRETGAGIGGLAMRLWPSFWRFGLLAALSATVSQVWLPNTLATLILASLGVGTVYVLVMFPLALRPPLGIYVLPRLESIRNRLPSYRRVGSEQ
ncbi:MAG: lipopolysaccharide biosynthesis protein [Gemmatimonadales bacterium]